MRQGLLIALLGTSAYAQMSGMINIFLNKLDNSPDGQCHQISVFTTAVNAINDPTLSAAVTGGDTMKQMMGQAVVMALNSKLNPLKSDQKVMAGCSKTIATDNMVIDCLTAQGAGKLDQIIANQTLLDKVTKGDAGKQDQLRKIQAALKPKADVVNGNSTESDYCKSSVDARCINEKVMAKFVSLAADDAAVNAHFDNNATLVQAFKDHATKAQQRLDKMKADTALSAVCDKMPNISPIDINAITLDDLPKTMPTGAPQMKRIIPLHFD